MATSRERILAKTLARLERERYAAPRRPNLSGPPPPPPITDEEAAENARILMEAVDEMCPDWRLRSVG